MSPQPPSSPQQSGRRIPPGLFTNLAVIIFAGYLTLYYWQSDPFYRQQPKHWALPIFALLFLVMLVVRIRRAASRHEDDKK